MLPECLAARHPRLYHVTEPGAWSNIKRHGLLSTSRLLDLFEAESHERDGIEKKRRDSSVKINHPQYGYAVINDNLPISEKALTNCLDDNLTPSEWFQRLNSRVFFWASKEGVNRLLNARLNRNRLRELIVVDTLSLAKVHAEKIELCPINSGATFRKAARRGVDTFTPMLKYNFKDWSKLRGQQDRILEVTVREHVLDIAQHTLEVLLIEGGKTFD
ncbi:MAG: hypothetical protein JSR85_01500 [Proteobacteria bacterium]|nr:hypothetical protein [Pseudomonadota bacterium]